MRIRLPPHILVGHCAVLPDELVGLLYKKLQSVL